MPAITVKAAPGLRVPYEDNARKYITEDLPVSVEDSIYYLRRLADGDLIRIEAQPPAGQADPAEARTPATPADPPSDSDAPPAAPQAGQNDEGNQVDLVDPPTAPATAEPPADQAPAADAAPARTTKRKGA